VEISFKSELNVVAVAVTVICLRLYRLTVGYEILWNENMNSQGGMVL